MDKTSSTPAKTKPFNWLTIIAFIFSIAALIAITISWVQLHHLQTSKSQSHALQAAKQQQLLATVSQLQSKINAQQQTIDSLESHLGHSAFRLKLTQVAAQLNLANLELTMNNDIDGALLQLNNIATTLTNQQDSRLMPLQRAINADIRHLKNAQTQNTPQLLSQFDALSQAVQSANFIPRPTTHTASTKKAINHGNWSQKLWSQLKQAKQLIVIRHHGPDLTPLLDPAQQQILRTLIQGRLLLCEYAIIHHNDVLFHQQLKQIKHWLQTLMLDSSTKDHLLKMVTSLHTVSLQTASHNLDSTIDLTNELMTPNKQDTTTLTQPQATPPATTLPSKPKPRSQPQPKTGVAI